MGLLVGLTSVSSQALKALLAYPRSDELVNGAAVTAEAFPSGHATASMTLAIALVLVVSSRLRPMAAIVGSALALGVSFSVVSQGHHFPSDVIGGFLLATGWTLVLLAGLLALEARYPERAGRGAVARRTRPVVDAVAGAGLAVVLIAGVAVTAGVGLGIVLFRQARPGRLRQRPHGVLRGGGAADRQRGRAVAARGRGGGPARLRGAAVFWTRPPTVGGREVR